MKKYLYVLMPCLLMLSVPAYARDGQITIKNHVFTPPVLTVSAGTKVTWTNHDQDPHTVIDSDSRKQFHSGALDTNDTYAYTFTAPGTYQYFCTLHPTMTGKIIVNK